MWARIENGIVAELTEENPEGRFHPSIEWVAADATVTIGDAHSADGFAKPVVNIDGILQARILEVDALRTSKIAAGKPHTFPDGTTGTVQLRHERDSVNINAVTTAGTALVAAGSDDTVAFRDAEDVTHTLTGAEAVQFGLAVMQWMTAHYAAAWAHKDAIRLLAHGTDLAALADYDIHTGWPKVQGEGAP